MRFSEHFGIKESKKKEWFDALLSLDTQLFIDPFLIFKDERNEFIGSHKEMTDFFEDIFNFVAKGNGDPNTVSTGKARTALLFPEFGEACLGFTNKGTQGSGSGSGYGKKMAEAIWEAIMAGIVHIDHFEEVSIFRPGLGPDRVSDITGQLLKHRFAKYTKRICKELDIPIAKRMFNQGQWDFEFKKWVPMEWEVPINPYNQKPLLLIPKRYLRVHNTINQDDFIHYAILEDSDAMKISLSYEITKKIGKEKILNVVRQKPELIKKYLKWREENPKKPYSFADDPQGIVYWYERAQEFSREHPVDLPITSNSDFYPAVDRMVNAYADFIHDNGGWQLLWNSEPRLRPKSEKAAQLLLLGVFLLYCRSNNIDISPEANLGRGPVDFKVSRGFEHRSLIEVKLARNSKFWNGLSKQLPTYLKSEQGLNGYFVVIVFDESDRKKIQGINEKVKEVNKTNGYNIQIKIVDASHKISASKL